MQNTPTSHSLTFDRGCITRGPQDQKVLAIQFTGDQFADGALKILDTLRTRKIKATFYFTGDFYRNPQFKGYIEQMIKDGHYIGPHGDKHLLYASWENPPVLLVDKNTFSDDLNANLNLIEKNFGVPRSQMTVWNPAYQHYTEEIAQWSSELGMQLVNYTPGTRTMCDYMLDDNPRYLTSKEMVESVYKFEQSSPTGLNGFIMHMHIGAGPGRTKDHLYDLLPEMLDELTSRGYTFARVDELLSLRKDK